LRFNRVVLKDISIDGVVLALFEWEASPDVDAGSCTSSINIPTGLSFSDPIVVLAAAMKAWRRSKSAGVFTYADVSAALEQYVVEKGLAIEGAKTGANDAPFTPAASA